MNDQNILSLFVRLKTCSTCFTIFYFILNKFQCSLYTEHGFHLIKVKHMSDDSFALLASMQQTNDRRQQ